ncbi:MAG: hypothetical protein IJO48_02230 [Clostridia bacterium]|nr:hypothetical protein [Clostridia bacterium]
MKIKRTLSMVLVVVMVAAMLVACNASGTVYKQKDGNGTITLNQLSGNYGEVDLKNVELTLDSEGAKTYTCEDVKFVLIQEENTAALVSVAVFFIPYEDNILNYRPALGLITNNFGTIRLGGNVYEK